MRKYLMTLAAVTSIVVGVSGQNKTPADDSRWGLRYIRGLCEGKAIACVGTDHSGYMRYAREDG